MEESLRRLTMERKDWKGADAPKTSHQDHDHEARQGRALQKRMPVFFKSHVIQYLSWCFHCDPNDALEKHAGKRCIPEERIDFWMKFTTAKSNSDPAQNYSLHFRNQKGKNLAWMNPLIATRKLVLHMSQVDMATRKLVQTISAVLPIVHVGGYSRQSFVRSSSVNTGLQTGCKDGT